MVFSQDVGDAMYIEHFGERAKHSNGSSFKFETDPVFATRSINNRLQLQPMFLPPSSQMASTTAGAEPS